MNHGQHALLSTVALSSASHGAERPTSEASDPIVSMEGLAPPHLKGSQKKSRAGWCHRHRVEEKNAEFIHGLSMVYLIEWLEIHCWSMEWLEIHGLSMVYHLWNGPPYHVHAMKSDHIPMKNLIKNHNTKISPSMIGAYITNFPYLSSQNMPWHFFFLTKSHQIPN